MVWKAYNPEGEQIDLVSVDWSNPEVQEFYTRIKKDIKEQDTQSQFSDVDITLQAMTAVRTFETIIQKERSINE